MSYLKTDSPSLDPLPFLDACALYGENDISRFYAIQIASTIVKECPEENRDAVIAIGPVGPSPGQPISKENREQLLEVVRLVQQCRVW